MPWTNTIWTSVTKTVERATTRDKVQEEEEEQFNNLMYVHPI